MENSDAYNKKRIVFSVIGGIYLSLVLHISLKFPPIDSALPALDNAHLLNMIVMILEYIINAFDSGYGIVQSLTAIVIAFLLFHIFDKLKECRYAHYISLILLSIIFGCINVAGLCMYWLDCLPMFSSIYWLIGCLLLALGWAFIFFVFACLIFQILDREKYIENNNKNIFDRKHFYFICFGVILVSWLPWIISYYPASMDNDVFGQLYAWFYEPNDQHPWFSTCVLANCYLIGSRLGSDNLGIFFYIIIRDILLALIYAKCVIMLKESGFHKVIYYGSLAFYAITPVWGAYAKHAFKDTFNTGLFCLYIMTLIMIILQLKKRNLTFQLCLFHGIAALLASLFRHNCIYAIMPAELLLLAILRIKKQPIRYISVILVCLVAHFGYNYYVIHFVGAAPSPVTESLAIPLQQTARLVRDHSDELDPDTIEDIGGIFIYEKLAEEYDPILSDPIKWNCQIPTEQKSQGANARWAKTWAKMLFRFPVTYLEAAIGQSYGYYSFTPNLPEKSGNWNSGMTIFDWIGCRGDFDESFDFHYMNGLDSLRKILHAWAKVWDRIPLLSLTDMCAFYTWGSVLLCYYFLFIKKQYLCLIPFVCVGFMILTCIASPVNDCFRYFAPVAASSPAFIVLLNSSGKDKSAQ